MNKVVNTTELPEFDLANYLRDEGDIAEYLTQVLADGDKEEFIRAVGYIAKARGMSQIARDSGLGRESLYKALAPGSNPRFETVRKVVEALGCRVSIVQELLIK